MSTAAPNHDSPSEGRDRTSGEPVSNGASVVSQADAFRTWARVAALSFGGPAGQMAVMHRIIVDEKRWVSEERFLHALNYCMLLPGPEAQQLATYIGWLMHRTRGGLVAGGLFILPGFLSILALSILYAEFQDVTVVSGLFYGLKAAVVAIVLEALLRIGRRVLQNGVAVLLAAVAFIAIFAFHVPFPIVVASAAGVGLIVGQVRPQLFQAGGRTSSASDADRASTAPPPEAVVAITSGNPWWRSLCISVTCLTLWWGPLLLLRTLLGSDSVYWREGVFFSQTAVVTFGGAYAALAYVAQQAVDHFGWLQPGEMLDGLGLAETTPGPLIMVLQFVGFIGAYRNPGPLSPLTAGILGSVVTTWVTFVPCFYWIFLGAPFVEHLRGNRALRTALAAVTAAVVGVILNLAVWFSIHALFGEVDHLQWSAIDVPVPRLSSLRWPALGITVLACLLTFVWKRGMGVTLVVCATVGLLCRWLAIG